MKAGAIAFAVLATLTEGAIEVRNSAFTTCDANSDASCGKLDVSTEAKTDLTEAKELYKNAVACVKANEGKGTKCYAGVEAVVSLTGDNLCTANGAGYYVALDAGDLKLQPYFLLSNKVPDANAGGTVKGKYMATSDATICDGTAGTETTYTVKADGVNIVAAVAGPSQFIPGLPVQDKINIIYSGEAGSVPKGVAPMLGMGVVAATATLLAATAW